MDDADIWRLANLMIRDHGPRAHAEAERRAVEFEREGQPRAAAIWRRIAVAIEELQRGVKPDDPVH